MTEKSSIIQQTNTNEFSQLVTRIESPMTTFPNQVKLRNNNNNPKVNHLSSSLASSPHVIEQTWEERQALNSKDHKLLLNIIQHRQTPLPTSSNVQFVRIDDHDKTVDVNDGGGNISKVSLLLSLFIKNTLSNDYNIFFNYYDFFRFQSIQIVQIPHNKSYQQILFILKHMVMMDKC